MGRLTYKQDGNWCVKATGVLTSDVYGNTWGEPVDRLAYYEDMEEQGRLKIFPCEVGDKAYWVNGCQIKDCKVHRIQVNRKGTFLVLKSTVVHGAFNIGTIGHTVFFDPESAKNALKGGAN